MAIPPGDRISKIKAIGLSLCNDELVDVELALVTFNVPWMEFDGAPYNRDDKYEYVLRRMTEADDATVTGLYAYLYEGTSTPGQPIPDPPERGEPLVFLSHTWKNKALAAEISSTFAELEIKGFVAHEDIEPSEDWAAEIERNLHACSALVAVLTEDLSESPFCNQEVGYALGHGRFVVAVMQNQKPPPGLAARYQAIPGTACTWKPGRYIAIDILDVLFKNRMTHPLVVKSMALLYTLSHNFDNARENYERILKIQDDEWTGEMMEVVESAGRENSQLAEGNYKDPVKGWHSIPTLVKQHLDRIRDRRIIAEGGVPAHMSDFAPAGFGGKADQVADLSDFDFGQPSGAEDDIPF